LAWRARLDRRGPGTRADHARSEFGHGADHDAAGRQGFNHCSATVVDGTIGAPVGAVVRSVQNTTLAWGKDDDHPTVALEDVKHDGGNQVNLSANGQPGDTSSAFAGQSIAGSWAAKLTGSNIPDDQHQRQATLLVEWVLP
jgi:hypothetical protein